MRLEVPEPTHAPLRRSEPREIAVESQEKTSLFLRCITPRSPRLCGGEFDVSNGLLTPIQETHEEQSHCGTRTPSLAVRVRACKPEPLRRLAARGSKARLRPQPSPASGRGDRALLPLPQAGEGVGHCSISRKRERGSGIAPSPACGRGRGEGRRTTTGLVSPRTPGADRGLGCSQAVIAQCSPPRSPPHSS